MAQMGKYKVIWIRIKIISSKIVFEFSQVAHAKSYTHMLKFLKCPKWLHNWGIFCEAPLKLGLVSLIFLKRFITILKT
jgi:hypothetical protein